MSKTRLAIIGCGQISDRFLREAAARDDCEFVAACARHLDSARAKAEQYGIPRWYDSYERLMDDVQPDGVVVATPHSLHAAPAAAALRRGIAVLNEKPMATSLEDCRAMVHAAEETGAVLMCLPFDHSPPFLTALQHLNEERLGKFTGAESVLLISGPPRDNWYYDRSVAHGGAMLDCLVYPLSRLISLVGPAAFVTARVNNLIPQRLVGDGKQVRSDVDDNDTLIVQWEHGQQAVVRSLWGTSFSRNDTTVYGRRGTLWLAGGTVVVHSPTAPVPGGEPIEWQGFKDCFRIPVSPDTPREGLIEHFVTCIREKRQPRCSGKLQLHVHEIMFKAYDAAETGRTQRLETTFTPWHAVDPAFYRTREAFI